MDTEREKIQSLLEDIARANGSLAVQTILFIMNRWFSGEEEDITIRGALFSSRLIKSTAHNIATSPDWWTYKGRFSEALFDEHYLKGGRDGFGIYADIMGVLRKLDQTYGENFSIESAQHYLNDIVECVDHMRNDLSALAA